MTCWVGIDVGGTRKGFDLALIDDARLVGLKGRLSRAEVVQAAEAAKPAVVAIDSPRSCAAPGQTTRSGERRLAKEICGIRWTPDEEHVRGSNPYYAWIVNGLDLFAALDPLGAELIEVFPTASWTRWHGKRNGRRRSAWSREALGKLGLEGLPSRTNQDQRDAIAAAVTAREHTQGMTEALGEIVVPARR